MTLAIEPSITPEIELPPGVVMQTSAGAITGKTLYRISNFEMPWRSSAVDALRVYTTLKRAYESGYFSGGAKKLEAERQT